MTITFVLLLNARKLEYSVFQKVLFFPKIYNSAKDLHGYETLTLPS